MGPLTRRGWAVFILAMVLLWSFCLWGFVQLTPAPEPPVCEQGERK